ncbi:MAG: ribosome small subunit-dependent GTPase A [Tepidisphaeraceae bacterium]|jgi:ribosome biogenesis GTPase
MMSRERRKNVGEKDPTARFLAGDFDPESQEIRQRSGHKSKRAQQDKIQKTADLRAIEELASGDIESLPIGQVVQVFSLFYQVAHPTGVRLCVVRKTLAKLAESAIVVGDYVRFRDGGVADAAGKIDAVIEQVLPRKTLLVRAGSFDGQHAQPIVANAEQMLIVSSLLQPRVKWGLVDRVLVAAQSGGLVPIICLNKTDLAEANDSARQAFAEANEALGHYRTLGIATLEMSAATGDGISDLKDILKGKTTVLGGHSGVGKSTVINAIQPGLGLRIGKVSESTQKGRHTTTSARRYDLEIGGAVIDTPGVKQFGLWKITPETLSEYYSDVLAGTAPPWRTLNYQSLQNGRE